MTEGAKTTNPLLGDPVPGPGNQDITEDKAPGLQKPYKVQGTHDQETRKHLAQIILIPLVLLYVAIMVCFLCGVLGTPTLTEAIAAMSGFQVLAAAAVGFYFGSKE